MSPSLPTGTVAFLFSDIQGSTQLWQRYPAEMPAALAQHHALLSQAIEAHEGYVFQIIGDAFCCAFHTVRDGLKAAIAAQHLLQGAEWRVTGLLQVRMALHAGAAEVRPGETTSGEYLSSITLSRTARLLSAGHGGQVLLSLPAAELVRDDLPESILLIDLGLHRLKDLVRPEQIYQAVTAGLQQVDFPPLKTLDSHPHNLPVQLTSFFGREKELAGLTNHLATFRHITVIGPGGTGKTRLALQLAAEHIDNFPDGVWLVDLSALKEPQIIPQALARAWELREQAGYSLQEMLNDFLHHKRLLLILDNCEHLQEACARLGHDLLLAAPELHLLATSREPLGIPGEVLYRLGTLPIPDPQHLPPVESLSEYDSVRLFINRAQLVQPAFSLSNANAPTVAQICARLDGIPLAIELAAARLRSFTPDQINARLEDRFRLLTGGSRTSLPRQQTLQATIDWSHNLLSDPERVLFRRLSVFQGGWTFEMAESVCLDDSLETYETLDLLPRLVDRSLVVADELPAGMRYRLLDTIRMYSRRKLVEAGEENAFERRHLEQYLRLARENEAQLYGAGQLEALETLESEHDNFRAALEFALHRDPEKALRLLDALWFFWFMHGHFVEGRQWSERAFQATEGALIPDKVRARALIVLGIFVYFQGDADTTRRLSQEGLELAHRVGDLRSELWHMMLFGNAQVSLGETSAGIQTFEQAIEMARLANDETMLARLLNSLGLANFAQGDLDQIESLFREAIELTRRLGDRWGLSYLLSNLSGILMRRGEFDQAEALVREAADALSQLKDPHGYGGPLHALANIAWRRGDMVEARSLLLEVLEIDTYLGRLRYIPFTVEKVADFMARQGGARSAAILLGAAQAYRRANNYPPDAYEDSLLQQTRDGVRNELGEQLYQAVFTEGESLTIEQAIDKIFPPPALNSSHM